MKSFDVIIVGGGVLGTSLAYHLSCRENISILLIEKEAGVARHASGKNAGMIRHLYRHAQLTDWAERSVKNFPAQLKDKHFKKTGSVILGRTAPGHHQHLFEDKYTTLGSETHPSVYTAEDGLLDSGSYMEDLRSLCIKQGVNFLFNTRVRSIKKLKTENREKNPNRWQLSTDKENYSCTWVVNATGAWINSIIQEEHPELQLESQGYARYLFLSEGWNNLDDTCLSSGFYWDEIHEWYMRDWEKGKKLVSACDIIPANPDCFTPEKNREEVISSRILKTIPEQGQEIRIGSSWHCFRTYTKDQLPVWGEDPQYNGLFWLAAFGGFGMSTSYAATQDAASYILDEEVFFYSDFCPSRVQVRTYKSEMLCANE